MLDNLNRSEPSEGELLKRISIARGTSEPDPAPTEEPTAVDVSEEAPDETETGEPEANEAGETEEVAQSEESSETVKASDNEEESEPSYVELSDGEMISLDEITELKQGNLRQQDYTRKTQELAETRKALDSQRSEFDAQMSTMKAHIETLESMMTDESEATNWDELRDYDPSEYLKKREQMESKQNKLQEAKDARKAKKDADKTQRLASEQQKLLEALPTWQDAKQREADINIINGYLGDKGYSNEQIQGIDTHMQWLTILDAAKFHAAKKGSKIAEKRVKKAPMVTKPKAGATNTGRISQDLKDAQSRFKRTGSDRDALAVMRLQRQAKGK